MSKAAAGIVGLAALAYVAWIAAPHAYGAASPDAPVYKPPSRGAPATRVGGGTRGGAGLIPPAIAVLAPDHTGYTTQDQPTLYWYLSKPTAAQVEITITDAAGAKRIAEHVQPPAETAGIQAVSLRDLNVRLDPGADYRWSVALVSASGSDSMNVLSSGTIRFVPAPERLGARLAKGAEPGRASVYAEEGYWYDAVDALVRRVRSGPDGKGSRSDLAALLKQGGVRASVTE